MTNFTADQERAIKDHGQDILVSASAGSGKTTVLVERVLQKILAGTPIDQLLIITFTKAAASEMKERIKNELSKSLANDPSNTFLRQQLLDVDTANISTIDAFCLDIIHHFYYVIDLDPAFSILTDDTQAALLRERALKEVEESFLENNDPGFLSFYDNFAGDREVDSAHNLLLDLYQTAMAQPNYRSFIQNLDHAYQYDQELVQAALWQEQIKPYLITTLSTILDKTDNLLSSSQFATKELQKVQESFTTFKTNLNDFLIALENDKNYDLQRSLMQKCIFTGNYRKSKKWDEDLLDIYEESQNFKKDTNAELKKLFAKFYMVAEEEQKKVLAKAEKITQTISRVELQLIDRFAKLKREQNLLDYSDMEQLACQILTGQSSKSQLAQKYYRNKFSEILIDEYQDVNELQEQIIQAIKQKGKNNLFMVGDVKQSIYGFRQARPQLFLQKYHDYADDSKDHERIILADNFRSTKNVTKTVNKLFDPILTKDFGGIDYHQEGQLIFGATYYPDDLPVASEFIYTDKQEAQNKQSALASSENEADFAEIQMVIARIKQLKREKFEVFDPKTGLKRPLKYSDIAILTRTRTDNLQIMQEFTKANLPLFVGDAQNYFQTFELIMIMNYLKIIDNPRQDIPLVAVMRSPIFGFTEPKLAQIRIKTRHDDFYGAVANYSSENNELGQKCKQFLNQLEGFRNFATTHRISELIWTIYEKTHLLEIVTGLPNGPQRRVNLESLYERATSYETAGFKGLYQFISFIERMRKNQKDLAQPLLSDRADDAIKLMTIHGSKGLEFPLVFVVGLNHKFQTRDLSNNYSIDIDSGLGLTIKEKNYRIDSLVKSWGDLAKKRQNLEEESRILYVGLTRARQKLILVASITNLDSQFKKWQQALGLNHQLPLLEKMSATSPMSFIGPELVVNEQIEHKIADIDQTIEKQNKIYYFNFTPELTEDQQHHALKLPKLENDTLLATVKRLYDYDYPFVDATKTTAYQAVSEIKKAFNDPLDKELENSHLLTSTNRYLQPIDETPQFLKQSKFTGAEIGTATHLLLQYYDYTAQPTAENLQAEIQQLEAERKLNPDIVPQISQSAIQWFVTDSFTKAFWQNPENLYREQEFSSLIKARKLFPDFSDPDAKILVHGTIDGYFVTEQGIILFDYKTDHVDESHEEQAIAKIKQRYQGQLRLYEAALNELSSQKVIEKYLILLDAKKVVKLD